MKTEIANLDRIHEVIIAYAKGDFSYRLPISDEGSEIDSVLFGINMLGEELQDTTISRDFFSGIFNSSSNSKIVIDLKGEIIEINNSAQKILSINPEKGNSINIFKLLNNNNKEFSALLKSNIASDNFSEFEVTFFDNSISYPIESTVTKLINRYNEHIGYLILIKNISEKKNQEQKIYLAVIDALEKERRRLAYDLHDSFSQDLNAVRIFIETLKRIDPLDPNFITSIDKCKKIIEQAITNSKNMAFNLLPKSLENGNLCHAISQLCEKYPNNYKFNLTFEVNSVDLDSDIKTIIYRIFQEFISNSINHSKANLITIHITKQKNSYSFLLNDNGIGFDMEQDHGGKGIHNIKSRLNGINANYYFESVPLQGTTLNFKIS